MLLNDWLRSEWAWLCQSRTEDRVKIRWVLWPWTCGSSHRRACPGRRRVPCMQKGAIQNCCLFNLCPSFWPAVQSLPVLWGCPRQVCIGKNLNLKCSFQSCKSGIYFYFCHPWESMITFSQVHNRYILLASYFTFVNFQTSSLGKMNPRITGSLWTCR